MKNPDYTKIPQATRDALDRYVQDHLPPGGYLTAVLENNLRRACQWADDGNAAALFELVSYLYNCCPSACWGDPARVEAWLYGATPQEEAPEGSEGDAS